MLPSARVAVLLQFVQFAAVGVLGLAAELATLAVLRPAAGLYPAGLAAYAVSATLTWWVNRQWTFSGRSAGLSRGGQWMRYLLANAPGFLVNRSVFFTLATASALCAAHPALAACAGSLAGLLSNFTFSRAFAFGK